MTEPEKLPAFIKADKIAEDFGVSLSTRMRHPAEYRCWRNIRQRLSNPRCPEFWRYGGRGIRMCPQWWSSFDAFLGDVGPRPAKGLSLDRIDNGGDYAPGNVRWATPREQQQNTRRNRLVEFGGERLSVSELARRHGLHRHTVRGRLERGLSPEQAVTK